MADRGKEPITDGARGMDALWENQENINRRIDDLSADIQRLIVEMRREFNLIRARQPQAQPLQVEQEEVRPMRRRGLVAN
ncbi:hypothetical protein MA16_Dca020084 [Dendrobium catenatum]|uniref:Uncharacterized protein n=1 Tax=Dendrobium catenatum TaxID=906689 RepID=A0A2I0X3Q5_9ASPA|nr:hypothetical protein MA16_Dca020084 [Dendrobium catenatum]